MRQFHRTSQSAFTFVELIFVSAIMTLIFGALLVSFQYTLELVALNRAKLSALSLANERMEFFRSLPYSEVGTLTGIVRGPVPNNQTIVFNNIEFSERIVVDYVDGVGDGIGLGTDVNNILTDYKKIKLEYTWLLNGETYDLSLISDIMPRSIETDVGGGSIRINVLDENFAPLDGATVEISNASSTAPLFESRVSNAGQVLLSGVPADSDYEILVTGPIGGDLYSSDGTYRLSAYNPNPILIPFAVVDAGVSTLTFRIDELSDITIETKSNITEASVLESFIDAGGVATTTDTTAVSGGDLMLEDTAGVYESTGVAFLDPIEPSVLDHWETVRVAAQVPLDTNYVVRLYTGSTTSGYTPIPDVDLPGNALGFSDSLIDISDLDTSVYATTTIGITLTTTNTSLTPRIEEVEVFWRESESDLSGHTLFVRGDKNIGTDGGGAPIYKSTTTVTTNSSGVIVLPDMEFDTYTATSAPIYDVAMACPSNPFIHRAGIDSEVELLIVGSAAHTLRTAVVDSLGRPIPGVTVQLQRAGYNTTQTTGACGQTFFTGGLTDNIDYILTISAPGYSTQTIDPFTVTGDTVTEITLLP